MRKSTWFWIPLLGIPLFVLLYVWVSFYYPGGSQADAQSTGFSWVNNYWCNLLNTTAINGQINSAQPIAMTAMVVLCISLAVFWYLFSMISLSKTLWFRVTQFSGIAAMATALLLNSSVDHDLITNLASLLGLMALVGTLIGLRRLQWNVLFWFGTMNLLLVLLNNFLYYNPELIGYLPLVQKISFAAFLISFFLISMKSIQVEAC
ncbi:MAG: hypothetical protein ACK5OP_03200 [Sphingobacteriales bacterium]